MEAAATVPFRLVAENELYEVSRCQQEPARAAAAGSKSLSDGCGHGHDSRPPSKIPAVVSALAAAGGRSSSRPPEFGQAAAILPDQVVDDLADANQPLLLDFLLMPTGVEGRVSLFRDERSLEPDESIGAVSAADGVDCVGADRAPGSARAPGGGIDLGSVIGEA